MKELLVGVPEAMRMLNLGRTKVNQMVGSGALASVKVGRRRLFRVADLEQFALSLPANCVADDNVPVASTASPNEG